MGLAMQNHVSALGVFPTGGNGPNPIIGDYTSGSLNNPGTPNGPNKQGLGWAYQLLPFLEQNAVKGLVRQDQLQSTVIPLYNCPSRRGPTKSGGGVSAPILTDYASAQPSTYPCGGVNYNPLDIWPFQPAVRVAYARASYWCNDPGTWLPTAYYGGVIVRTPYRISGCSPGVTCSAATTAAPARGEMVPGYMTAVKPSQITDGLSNTLVLSEKLVRTDKYDGGGVSDDKGWADGWDPDTIRFTGVPPISDGDQGVCWNSNTQIQNTCIGDGSAVPVLFFGSAHSGGVNAAFADASCRFINFEVDHLIFNAMGTRDFEDNVAQN
jgi:prepilin-type processing-associated H-X9-DG protein